jgi:5-methylcytosine-specific restriction protein A
VRDTSRAFRALCARLRALEPLCRYCRNQGRIAAATVTDHIVALSLGGTDDVSNLCPSCLPCNSAKGIVERRFAAKGYDHRDIMLDPDLAGWIELARKKPVAP